MDETGLLVVIPDLHLGDVTEMGAVSGRSVGRVPPEWRGLLIAEPGDMREVKITFKSGQTITQVGPCNEVEAWAALYVFERAECLACGDTGRCEHDSIMLLGTAE